MNGLVEVFGINICSYKLDDLTVIAENLGEIIELETLIGIGALTGAVFQDQNHSHLVFPTDAQALDVFLELSDPTLA